MGHYEGATDGFFILDLRTISQVSLISHFNLKSLGVRFMNSLTYKMFNLHFSKQCKTSHLTLATTLISYNSYLWTVVRSHVLLQNNKKNFVSNFKFNFIMIRSFTIFNCCFFWVNLWFSAKNGF
jgi:hypothetical protein